MINDFRIGADPEFVMADKDNLLHIWPEDDEEITTNAGEVGPDHGGYVAELRPKPTMGTYALVRRIKTLLTDPAWGDHRKYRWLAGPVQTVLGPADTGCDCCCRQHCACDYDWEDRHEEMVQPLGGHIHLDIRANNPKWDSVVNALDVQHRFFEDLELYPKDACDLRREEGYGKFGWVTCNSAGNAEDNGARYEKADLDAQIRHGYVHNPEQFHMEFRTPPSWLNHPRLAMLALTSAKLAAADPEGTIDALKGKPIALNTLRDWYDRYKGKDANADRVAEQILHGKRVEQLQFDTSVDLKDVWETIDF